jgi:hypothetical protein
MNRSYTETATAYVVGGLLAVYSFVFLVEGFGSYIG